MTRRMSAILGEYSPAGQGCTRHFSVPPLEYKNSTSYKKYRPNFGLNIQESYGKRPMGSEASERSEKNSITTSKATQRGTVTFPVDLYFKRSGRAALNFFFVHCSAK